jgi:hypothetical protein
MDTELSDEFFQMLYSLPKESEVIISDNEVFAELGLTQYIYNHHQRNLYIDVTFEQIDSLIDIYFKKIFDQDEHLMLYNHNIVYSYYDCVEFIKLYEKYLHNYQYNLGLFVNDKFYKDIYLNCKRISENHLLIRPKNFLVFKVFVNQYYEFIINKLKLTIKYLYHNISLYKEPLTNDHFSNVELLELLTDINEILATKTTFKLFREYGIPIKMKNKHNLVTNKLLNQYIYKHLTKFTLDVKVLLIEYYKYEYLFSSNHRFININEIVSQDIFRFNLE